LVKFNVYQLGQITTAAKFHNIGEDLDMPFTGVNFTIYGSIHIAENPDNTAIGGYFSAENALLKYSLQLLDGTQATGRFLKAMTSDGKANWADLTLADISDYVAPTPYTLPIASVSTLGGIKVGSGLTIDAYGALSTTATPSFEEVVFFDQTDPNTIGTIFTPNTPESTTRLYTSSVDSSTWIWDGSTYVTQYIPPTLGTWNLLGTSTDAGGTKTAEIERYSGIRVTNDTRTRFSRMQGHIVDVYADDSTYAIFRAASVNNSAGSSSTLELRKIRGTSITSTLSNVLNGDILGSIYFAGYQPTTQLAQPSAKITVVAAEDFLSNTNVSAIMSFALAEIGTGTLKTRLSILDNGKLKVNEAYSLPLTDGTATQVLTTDGAGNLYWSTISTGGGGTITGSGTDDYVARWLTSTNLGIGVIRDNGSTVGINTAPVSNAMLKVATSTINIGIEIENSYGVSLGNVSGLSVNSSGSGSLLNQGIISGSTGNNTTNYGVVGWAQNGTTNIGLRGQVTSGTDNYPIELTDFSTSSVPNRFLKNFVNGRAKWETSFTIDSDKVAKFEGQVYSELTITNSPLGTTQTINWNSGNSQKLYLGLASGNVALSFTNAKAGATYFLRINQGATPRNITFATPVKLPGGTPITLTATANAEDTIVIFYDGNSFYANYSLNYL
jgi:hypothetical protein